MSNDSQQSIFRVESQTELLKELGSTNISVPGRKQGRKSESKEIYSIHRLLSTISNSNDLSFPLSLHKREKPDFLLSCSNYNIGIEITEATSQDYSEYLTLADKEDGNILIEPALFHYNSKTSLADKKELLKQDSLISDGWAGDGMEKEWSLYIKDSINKKSKKFIQSEFQKFNQNWLHIYDNTPTLCLDKELLTPYLYDIWQTHQGGCFNKIFIDTQWIDEEFSETQSVIIVISKEKLSHFQLLNLWQD